jgi:transposase
LNPIENAFSKLKSRLRAAWKRKIDDLETYLGELITRILARGMLPLLPKLRRHQSRYIRKGNTLTSWSLKRKDLRKFFPRVSTQATRHLWYFESGQAMQVQLRIKVASIFLQFCSQTGCGGKVTSNENC